MILGFYTRCRKCRESYEVAVTDPDAQTLETFERDTSAQFSRLVCVCVSKKFEPLKKVVTP